MVDQTIGNYRLVRKIGEGGMGVVYEALHQQIGRRAAVKVLHAALARDPQIAARFLNEARAANLVQHPGIVDIYEFGQTPDGVPYIIMQYQEGESLRARLQRLSYLGADALRLGRQLASALSAAHARHIVHRDLKPDNIMIVADAEAPGGERARVLDFGIAKVAAELRGPGGGQRTGTGLMMGTPAYMAPEQCRGLSSLDDRADVYALGIILFEMVAGTVPFSGDMGELIAAHLYQPPPELPPELPGAAEVGDLVRRMLAKAPKDRPCMEQVAAELERSGAPPAVVVTTAPPGRPRQVPTPFPVTPPPISTFTRSTGQAVPAAPGERRTWPAVCAGLLVLALGAGGLALRSGSKGPGAATATQPGPAAAPPAPRHVRWSIRSRPPGAQVLRQPDDRVLGVTPWEEEHEAARGATTVLLRKEGYEDRELLLERDRDERHDEELAAVKPAGPAAPMATETTETTIQEVPVGRQAGAPHRGSRAQGSGKGRHGSKSPAQADKPTMWND